MQEELKKIEEGGRGFTGIRNGVDGSIQGIQYNVKMSKERLIRASNNDISNIKRD